MRAAISKLVGSISVTSDCAGAYPSSANSVVCATADWLPACSDCWCALATATWMRSKSACVITPDASRARATSTSVPSSRADVSAI